MYQILFKKKLNRVNRYKFIFILLLIFNGCDDYSYNSPENQGVSSQKLEKLTSYFNKSINENKIPGAVTLIRKNGKIVYKNAFGYSDVSKKIKYNEDDIFRIASLTKAVTSIGVLILWEEGKFDFDDPIEKYIPEFKNLSILSSFNEKDSTYTKEKAKNKITIRHLLTHTSGIGYGIVDSKSSFKAIYSKNQIVDLFTTDSITIKENIKKLAKLPLHHEPGEGFTYSESTDVLGYFIEIMSKMPLDKFFKERIFNPLQMNDTFFYLPETHRERLVPVQTKMGGFWMNFEEDFYDINYPKNGAKIFFSGGAGLSSTVEDYSNFLQMILNEGTYNGNQILDKKTVDLIYQNQNIEFPEFPSIGLAFGLITEKEIKLGETGNIGTLFWGGYFNAYFFADPTENLIGIVYKQTRPLELDNSNNEFRSLVLQSLEK